MKGRRTTIEALVLEDRLDGVLTLNVRLGLALLLEGLDAVLEGDDAAADEGEEVLGGRAEGEDEVGEVEERLLVAVLDVDEATTAADTLEDDSAVVEGELLLEGALEEGNSSIEPTRYKI